MNQELSRTCLEDLIQDVYKVLKFPKFPLARKDFCLNLCIVALGIRAGYLIDSFSPDDGVKGLQQLLSDLRREWSCFDDVRLLYAVEYGQYFFVNMTLLRERSKIPTGCIKEKPLSTPTFVLLSRPETVVVTPLQVSQTVNQIAECSEDPIQLSRSLTAKTLIPLSGFLLEFPVAYAPSSDDPSVYLSGVQLDVYECTLVVDNSNAGKINTNHRLLKFSCPAHLGASHESLAPKRIVEVLDTLFRERLEKASRSGTLRVTHSVISQNGVAL